MSEPIAFNIRSGAAPQLHAIAMEPEARARIRRASPTTGPAILVASNVAVVERMKAGILDGADATLLVDGDWSEALLLVLPQAPMQGRATPLEEGGDRDFMSFVKREAPGLLALAGKLLAAIRGASIPGGLRMEGSRWVNRPLNTFTLSVQPRVQNFAFTLYGGADRFGASDFIRSDQNGYSRGWVRTESDIPEFVRLAKIAYDRKIGRGANR